MKKLNFHFKFSLLLSCMISLSACKKITAGGDDESTTATVASLGSYTCPTYSSNTMYDSAIACQLATAANCTSSSEVFPNGSSATCYTPKVGWQSCATSPPTWEYTAYTVLSITPTGYRLKRNLLGCSSEVCSCTAISPPVPEIQMDVTFGAFVENVSGLPGTCTTTTCAPYIYQGALSISGLTFTLNTSPAAVGTPAVSTDAAPTMTVAGPNGFTMSVYSNATCTTLLATSPVIAAGTATTGAMAITGSGMKSFWVTLTNGVTTTACTNTGTSYYKVVTPVLAQPVTAVIPSALNPAGAAVLMNFVSSDNTGVTYTCMYDNIVSGSIVGGANCSTLPSLTFNTANGLLSYSPSNTWNGTYEFRVIGTNMAGSHTRYASMHFINGAIYTISPMLDGSSSANANPTITVNGGAGAPSFNYGLFSDSTCTSLLGTTALTGGGTGSFALTVSGTGSKKFYGMFQEPITLSYSKCLDTGMDYVYVNTPALAQPTPAIFPSNQVKTGVSITLNFQANVTTGVTYSCKYDQFIDNSTGSGNDCISVPLSGSTFSTSTGIVTWTPAVTAFGPYEFCVTGTSIAGSDTKCVAVDVIPANLVLNNLTNYFDAQFATALGGQNSNSNTSAIALNWNNLASGTNGTLTSYTGPPNGYFTPIGVGMMTLGTTTTAWVGNGTAPNAYAVKLNNDAGTVPVYTYGAPATYPFVANFHEDYVDLGLSTNQTVTIDTWVKVTGKPISTAVSIFNTQFGNDGTFLPTWVSCMVAWTGFTWMNQPNCPTPWCSGAGCVAYDFNQYPVENFWGSNIVNYFDPSNTNDEGLKISVIDNGITGWNGGVNGTYAFGGNILKPGNLWAGCTAGAYTYGSAWHHVVTVWDQAATRVKLFVDGVTICDINAGSTFMANIPRQLRLGAAQNKANARFKGEIANVRLYNSANTAIPVTNCSAERQRFGVAWTASCP